MAKEPNLIRRPLVVRGREVVMGYDEDGFRRLLHKRG
jgi:arsenate reductase-like glutaredoxin family protein